MRPSLLHRRGPVRVKPRPPVPVLHFDARYHHAPSLAVAVGVKTVGAKFVFRHLWDSPSTMTPPPEVFGFDKSDVVLVQLRCQVPLPVTRTTTANVYNYRRQDRQVRLPPTCTTSVARTSTSTTTRVQLLPLRDVPLPSP